MYQTFYIKNRKNFFAPPINHWVRISQFIWDSRCISNEFEIFNFLVWTAVAFAEHKIGTWMMERFSEDRITRSRKITFEFIIKITSFTEKHGNLARKQMKIFWLNSKLGVKWSVLFQLHFLFLEMKQRKAFWKF